MADARLLIQDPAGRVMFDSRDAAGGGVCLGIVHIPAGTAPVFTYPSFGADRVGFCVNTFGGFGGVAEVMNYDTAPGCPRFQFGLSYWDRWVALFLR